MYPAFGELLMSINAGEHPTEDVILLYDMRCERCLYGEVKDFTLVDQPVAPDTQDDGTMSRHLEMSRLQSKAGSSLALPAVSRARQSSTSAALSSRLSARKPSRLNTAPLPS